MLKNLITRKKTEKLKISRKTIKTQPPKHLLLQYRKLIEISHDKLPPIPEKSAFMFHYNFCLKPRVDLEDTDITQEIRQKLLDVHQKYDDITSKHSSNIGLTHLEEMKIDTDPNLPLLQVKPYPLPLKHS